MSDNKRIAKNTIYLYIRALISMLIGLYTSRVVIDVLGVDNYGVYGVAGGVVGMLAFLNAAMAGATSRFITVAIGKGNREETKNIVANALSVHILIALFVLIVCEAVGVWFLNCKLNIPPQSKVAANWVFQISILTTMVGITQVPYTALIMSHERMNIYAIMELVSVSLKLVVVYLLLILPGDKLIIYACLYAIVSFGMAMAYRVYCIRQFPESRTLPKIDKNIIKPMLSFSGWDLYGNSCVTFRAQGTTYLLNIFFGVAINGAASIVAVLNGVLSSLSSNITTAFRPQIIKNYASQSWERFQSLIENSSIFASTLLSMMAIPLILETPYIFGLWLGNVPEYVVIFSRINIISAIIGQISAPLIIGIHATGKIKMISFISGTVYLSCLPAIYVAFKLGATPPWAFIIGIAASVIGLLCNALILKHNVEEFKFLNFFMRLCKLPAIMFVPAILCTTLHYIVSGEILRLALIIIVCIISTLFMAYQIGLNKEQKQSIIMKVMSRLHCRPHKT